MQFLLRVLIYAVALWVTSVAVSGIHVTGVTTVRDAGTLLLVALIFSLVNAVIKPVVKVLGCALYVVTLGLFALVVNALLFLLTEWFAELLRLPFRVDGFWAAFWGAIVMSIVSWLLSLILPGGRRKSEDLLVPHQAGDAANGRLGGATRLGAGACWFLMRLRNDRPIALFVHWTSVGRQRRRPLWTGHQTQSGPRGPYVPKPLGRGAPDLPVVDDRRRLRQLPRGGGVTFGRVAQRARCHRIIPCGQTCQLSAQHVVPTFTVGARLFKRVGLPLLACYQRHVHPSGRDQSDHGDH